MIVLSIITPGQEDTILSKIGPSHYLSFFSQNHGHFPITIKEFYLSEAQSGKDLCSLKTGSCQMHVARFLNEENDNLSASYLMRALVGNNGLKGTKAYVISINNAIPNSSDNPSEHF